MCCAIELPTTLRASPPPLSQRPSTLSGALATLDKRPCREARFALATTPIPHARSLHHRHPTLGSSYSPEMRLSSSSSKPCTRQCHLNLLRRHPGHRDHRHHPGPRRLHHRPQIPAAVLASLSPNASTCCTHPVVAAEGAARSTAGHPKARATCTTRLTPSVQAYRACFPVASAHLGRPTVHRRWAHHHRGHRHRHHPLHPLLRRLHRHHPIHLYHRHNQRRSPKLSVRWRRGGAASFSSLTKKAMSAHL